MKKTVTVNISGIFFHIDEDAYDKISKYIETLKFHFQNNTGKDEIISDIESRIAEILQSKVNDKKQVITMEDIDEIISILGKPEDFSDESEDAPKTNQQNNTYRNKRLYRDADSRILGGVASGIAHYFNVDPIWIRLAFVATFYILGPLVYIIAWIIIPQARTTAEKLEMKGERVNISNIENSIKEEFGHIKNKVNEFANDSKEYYKNSSYKSKGEKTMYRSLDFLENIARYTVKSIIIFAGIILVGMGIALIVGLIMSVSSSSHAILANHNGNILSLPSFLGIFLESQQQISIAIIGILLLVGVPIIMIIYGGIKMILGIHQRYKAISFSALSLWLAGLFITLFSVFSGLESYQERGFTKQQYSVSDSLNQRLILKIKPSNIIDEFDENSDEFDINFENHDDFDFHNFRMTKQNGEFNNYGYPQIDFKPSNDKIFQITAIKTARGKTSKDAKENAERINYNISVNDSVILFDKYFMSNIQKWRKQDLRITVKVPVGSKVYIDQSFEYLKYYSDYNSILNDLDKYNQWYTMTETGLKCDETE
ncbi:MAG: PspC domain-containing protein [Bacteroidota bacterium]